MPAHVRPMNRSRHCLHTLTALVGVLVLAMAASMAGAAGGDEFAARVMAARLDAGAAPQRGLATLQTLRNDALAQQRIDLRLMVDEAECRILTDLDASRALAVADAGLASVGANPEPPAREPWLRLRVCRAGMLVEAGEIGTALGEFEALLSLTAQAADSGIHALALLERGVHRSRSGDWGSAQPDLLSACERLKRHGAARDLELCLGHLGNHYQRVGDVDEAMRLLQTLNAAARQRGAVFDGSVYSFGLGQVQQAQERWAEAIGSFEEAAEDSRQLGDDIGLSFAEHAIAVSQLKLGRARDALAYAERALQRLNPAADPRQYEFNVMTRAEALAALGRAAEANAALERIEPAVRKRGEQPGLALWFSVRADAMHQLGRWREAYQALADARAIQDKLHALRLSHQSALLRMQFNRARDADDLSALRQLNEQGQRLRQTQAVALVLFVILLAVMLVVAARKFRQTRYLQNLASTDDLTGLANRRALLDFANDAVAKAQRQAAPLAALMIDIDHFKRINDRHGHPVGDQVLRHASRVLASGLREQDRLGRIGGEEFVAMLPGTTVAQALQVAERMRRAVDATTMIGPSGEVHFTVSIGVAGARIAESASALLARADAALYVAKNGGRNAVAIDETDATPGSAA